MKIMRTLSFLSALLWLPALAAAQAGVTLLVKADTSCNWTLDGQPMGMLKADAPRVVLVPAGEHLILASATGGAATVRIKVEVEKVEKTVSIELRSQNAQSSGSQGAENPGTPANAGAGKRETWTDPATGLMWTSKDNGSNLDWPQATAYCAKLQLAGYKSWRLPTNEELQGIYDPTLITGILVDRGIKYDLHVKGNLTITGGEWSSSEGKNIGQPAEAAWTFRFGGKLDSMQTTRPRV